MAFQWENSPQIVLPLLENPTNYRRSNHTTPQFRSAQYMGNHRENLLWPHIRPNPNFTLCQVNDKDTWPHLLSLCNNKFLKGLRIARYNVVAHQLTNLLKSNVYTRNCTPINASNQHGNHQDNTILPWILSCTCNTTQCECLTKLRPNIVYIQGVAYEQNGPLIPTLDLTIQIIEFTFVHDKFLDQAIQAKEDKYNPLVNAIRAHGWNIRPLIVITAG